jgi:hypothetical protein
VVPGSSLSPPASVVNSGSLDSMLELTAKNAVLASEPGKRRLRLRGAAIDHDFAAPVQPKVGPGTRKIREIPASADVAQLVEHFTRNEGVPGSSPGVGSDGIACNWRDFGRPAESRIGYASGRGQRGGQHRAALEAIHRVSDFSPVARLP